MFDALWARLQQKYRTFKYPDGPAPALPDRFAGRPVIRPHNCPADCRRCLDACPTQAISKSDSGMDADSGAVCCIDLGGCLFCRDCAGVCPNQVISFTDEHQLAARGREDLIIGSEPKRLSDISDADIGRLFGRSLKLRQVSAGGCNACEADTNVLGTVGWDLGRFGIQFVASPRHADGLLITGPVSENMHYALLKTYEAVPSPKLVIAVGACAISGGIYKGHSEVRDGADSVVPVDLYIPGCPPHPLTIMDGLLRFIGRIQ